MTQVVSLPKPKRLFDKNDNLLTDHSRLSIIPNEDNSLEGYYVHKKSLGEGGFGKVRLATHLKTNQKVAIKMMNKAKLGNDLERVRIEIDALKVLQHQNIAKMLQYIETDTDIYLILEYCSGGELFDYLISKKRLTETEVRIIMKDLFKVLTYIHNRGFAHRDLKPENILFNADHKIKLIDFGLAANSSKNKARLAFLQTCCGSPAYAAPELLKGLTYSGPAVDVWSAGVLLYSLLVGQLPFDDDNVNNLYKKIQIGQFIIPQWLSADVRDLISSMLKTNPVDRITVAKALEHRWIKKGFIDNSFTSTSVSSPIEVIDPKAFQCCKLLFPKYSEQELKCKLKDFGYITSTYLLLRNNPEAIKNLQLSHQTQLLPISTQQQRLFGSGDQPRIAAVKRKLQLDCDLENKIFSQDQSPIKKLKENGGQELNNPNFLNSLNGKNTPVTPKMPAFLVERKQMLNNIVGSGSRQATPYPTPNLPKRLNGRNVRVITSPKMKAKKPKIINDENVINGSTPTKITKTMQKKPEELTRQETIKSPLRAVHNQVLSPIRSPVVDSPIKTPVVNLKNKILLKSSTKKSSLLRRLMTLATPGKSQSPRKLDRAGPSSNITMTTYKQPQDCLDHLTRSLNEKGVECKQKDFTLKCFYNDKIHSTLKFELEICRYNGLCVIHRKRLKGDAWNYKKICELILSISNEQQLAALSNKPVPLTTSNNASESVV